MPWRWRAFETIPGRYDTKQEAGAMSGFPYFAFAGSPVEIGRQHGEQARDLIHQHIEMATGKLRAAGIDADESRRRAALYMPYIQQYTPKFAEELTGLAEGANITIEEAYMLQLRAELQTTDFDAEGSEAAAEAREAIANECTTFAIAGELTADGVPIAGQNADLPAPTRELGVVMKVTPDDGRPEILMLTPAGQISYIGISGNGMAAFANFINTTGWRAGFPRYFLSRTALEEDSVADARKRLASMRRASSRNLILMGRDGDAVDLELAVEREGVIEPENGVITHANHFCSPAVLDEEQAKGDRLKNSCTRHERMRELIESKRGSITVDDTIEFFRDRAHAPDAICRHEGDGPGDYMTFASVIARPSLGELYVAPGPPDKHEYTRYALA
ncbi:MAG: C45 family peptidase [Thermomicrobiales bacterium]